jgi:hypothetical protein
MRMVLEKKTRGGGKLKVTIQLTMINNTKSSLEKARK